MVRRSPDTHAGPMEPHAVDDPPRTPTSRPAVRRSTTDRHIGGVSSAVARYLGVSVTLARVGLVAAVLVGGLGLVIYAGVWLFVPDDAGRVLIHGQSQSSTEYLLVAVLSGVSALLVSAWITRDGPSWLVALLVTVGVFILARRGQDEIGLPPSDGATPPPPPDGWTPPPSPPPPPPPSGPPIPFVPTVPPAPISAPEAPAPSTPSYEAPAPAETGVLPLGERTAVLTRPSGRSGDLGLAPVTALPTRAPRPPKPMAFLGPLTVSIAVAIAGSLMLLHAVGAIDLRPSDVLITVLAVIGLGLLVSTWFGRARGLILLGLVLVPIVAVSAAADRVDLRGGIGERRWVPETAAAVRDEYRLGAGSMQLDLTEVDPASVDTLSTDMSLGAGELQLVVPQDWTLDIDAGVDIGSVWFFDHGVLVDPSTEPPFDPAASGDQEFRMDLNGDQDWFFPDRQDVTNDGRSGDGDLRSLHVDGAEGAPTLDVQLHVTAGVVEVFRVAA